MIPGPYESQSKGFVRSFIHLGTSKHSFQEGFLVQQWSVYSGLFLSFAGGAGPCSYSIFGIGIAIAESASPHLHCIVAAEEVNGKRGMRYIERSDLTAGGFCYVT
jgi:hypothetical protein